MTLFSILGLIGGFIGLIWDISNWIFADYEEFSKDNSLISKFYTVHNSINSSSVDFQKKFIDEIVHDSKEKNPKMSIPENLKKKLREQTEYDYGYCNFYLSRILVKCRCCCKNKKGCSLKQVSLLDIHQKGV